MRSSGLRLGAAVALAALAVLVGCRTAPPTVPAAINWQTRRPQLQARTHFELRGRVAVASGDEGFNANLRWVQDGTRSQVTLEGPLGVSATQITAEGAELSLLTAHGERIDSEAAHAALAQRLGFDPPLASLRYWVLGVPDPTQPSTEELDAGHQRLSALEQAGWRIDYSGYTSANGETLPARLTMQRDAVRVRLLVDDWQL